MRRRIPERAAEPAVGFGNDPSSRTVTCRARGVLMTAPIQHANETKSNAVREQIARSEPRSLRTYHADAGRPRPQRGRLPLDAGRPPALRLHLRRARRQPRPQPARLDAALHRATWAGRTHGQRSPITATARRYFSALPMTAYNAVTPVEIEASRRLLALLQGRPGGKRLEQVMWAASGSEAIQKALWAALARDTVARHDPRHALRLPRQERAGRRRHRLRNRPRPRPARPLHQLSDGGMRRRQPARTALRPRALSPGTGRPATRSSAGGSAS